MDPLTTDEKPLLASSEHLSDDSEQSTHSDNCSVTIKLPRITLSRIFSLIAIVFFLIIIFSSKLLMRFVYRHHSFSVPFRRNYNNLVYWTPQKTGSSSFRAWLVDVSTSTHIPVKLTQKKYPYSNLTDWYFRSHLSEDESNISDEPCMCSILAGHIRSIPDDKRIHEGTLGAVITTTRDSKNLFASKFFHRLDLRIQNELPQLKIPSSIASKRWFYYFDSLDPCEQLRYYDGHHGCDLVTISERIQRIVNRIDCTINTDDPDPDIKSLCQLMRLKKCPQYPKKYVRGVDFYGKLYESKHILPVMDRTMNVTNLFRKALLKKGCRNLVNGDELSLEGIEPPRFPTRRCGKKLEKAKRESKWPE